MLWDNKWEILGENVNLTDAFHFNTYLFKIYDLLEMELDMYILSKTFNIFIKVGR